MKSTVDFINKLSRVNESAGRSYRRIATRSNNAVLSYVLKEIVRLKLHKSPRLQPGNESTGGPNLSTCDWESPILKIYADWERRFVDDDADRLTEDLLRAEQRLLEVVEHARVNLPSSPAQTVLTDQLAHSREVCSKLGAMLRYSRNHL